MWLIIYDLSYMTNQIVYFKKSYDFLTLWLIINDFLKVGHVKLSMINHKVITNQISLLQMQMQLQHVRTCEG